MTYKLYPQRAVKTLDTATCHNQMRVFAFKQITLVNKAELWTKEEAGQDMLGQGQDIHLMLLHEQPWGGWRAGQALLLGCGTGQGAHSSSVVALG